MTQSLPRLSTMTLPSRPEEFTSGPSQIRTTKERCAVLLEALPFHIRVIVLFLLTTGLRRMEAFNLTWPKVNREAKTITVRVKGGYERTVHLTPEAVEVLNSIPKTGLAVFDTTNWRDHFEKALRIAGIDDFTWHDLRHTFATWLGQSGAPLEIIRDQLGHSSIAMTQKYRHVVQGELQKALQKLPPVVPPLGKVVYLKRS
jgi:integrase